MLAEGLIRAVPDALGLWSAYLPLGTVAALTGPMLASGSHLDMTPKGQGSHGSQPYLETPLVTA